MTSLTWFVKRMLEFSDDGLIFHGAYGHRWVRYFGKNQLEIIINRLAKHPTDRRCVLSMWDAPGDLMGKMGVDVPCNTSAYFSIGVRGDLDMTVSNRSNDIIWGAYGANAVHFSFLQKYIAERLGISVGRYWQISNNFHAYEKVLGPLLEKDFEFTGYRS